MMCRLRHTRKNLVDRVASINNISLRKERSQNAPQGEVGNKTTNPAVDLDAINIGKLESDHLKARIQALPQELQDAIFEKLVALTFARNSIVHITGTYKPPLALQINKKLRSDLAIIYYSQSTFRIALNEIVRTKEIKQALVPHRDGITPPDLLCFYWLEQLNVAHRDFISTIRFPVAIPTRNQLPNYIRHYDRFCAWRGLPPGGLDSHAEFRIRMILRLFTTGFEFHASPGRGFVLQPRVIVLKMVGPEMKLRQGVWYRGQGKHTAEGCGDIVACRELTQ